MPVSGASQFNAGWFLGTITDMVMDGPQLRFVIDYDDGDQQDMDEGEIWDHVYYHPRMDERHYSDTQLPTVGEVVVFALNQQFHLGVMTDVNGVESKPVSVALWKPHRSRAKSLSRARFHPSMSEGRPDIIHLVPVPV